MPSTDEVLWSFKGHIARVDHDSITVRWGGKTMIFGGYDSACIQPRLNVGDLGEMQLVRYPYLPDRSWEFYITLKWVPDNGS